MSRLVSRLLSRVLGLDALRVAAPGMFDPAVAALAVLRVLEEETRGV